MIGERKRLMNRMTVFAELLLVSFVCITINSKNSFLYAMNDSVDIQQFVTAARCMLKGDVLYRDIYEVKGPVLYFIYCLGMRLFGDPFRGIYILEIVFFMLYLLSIYKLSTLYLQNRTACMGVSIVTAFFSTISIHMFGGGQCEELVLPFIGGAMCIAMRYVKKDYPRRIHPIHVISIGVLFAMVFWMKYSCTGLFLGLTVWIVVMQIKNKTFTNIILYAVEFLLGFSAVSGLVFAYFVKHDALGDLFKTYFYDMIFGYGSDMTVNLLVDDIYKLLVVNSFLVIGIVYYLFAPKESVSRAEKYVLASMMFFQAIGIVCSHIWDYSYEIMEVFTAVGVIVVVRLAVEYKEEIVNAGLAVIGTANNMINGRHKKAMLWIVLLCLAVLAVEGLMSGDSEGILEFVLAFLTEMCLLIFAIKRICKSIRYRRHLYELKYACEVILLAISCFMGAAFALASVFLIAMSVIVDMFNNFAFVKNIVTENVPVKRLDIYRKAALSIAMLAGLTSLSLIFSPVITTSKYRLAEYPQYQMSSYILSSGVKNPKIVNRGTLETGVYYLTDTYPPTQYISNYNFLEDYDDVVSCVEPDFIVSSSKEEIEGYTCVYEGEITYLYEDNHRNSYFLYRKEDAG